MSDITSFLKYAFHPNPGFSSYSAPSMMTLLIICTLLLVGSFAVRYWRSGLRNPITKKLSRSWSGFMLTMSLVGYVLVVSRVEGIQILAMRAWWGLWLLVVIVYVVLQYRLFHAKHYEVLPKVRVEDPKEKYLPKRRK
jgi:phosphatidylglycerophosphate synthase